MRTSFNIERLNRIFLCVIATLFISMFCFQVTADAGGIASWFGGGSNRQTSGELWSGDGTGSAAEWDMSDYRNRIVAAYNMVGAFILPLAVVSFSAGGFMIMFGNEKNMEKGKKQMMWTIIALGCYYIIPEVITEGVNIARQFAWDPGNPGTG